MLGIQSQVDLDKKSCKKPNNAFLKQAKKVQSEQKDVQRPTAVSDQNAKKAKKQAQ